MSDASLFQQLQACEGLLADTLMQANRQCLRAANREADERELVIRVLFNMLADRGGLLLVLQALGKTRWPGTYGQSPYEEISTVLRCASQGLAMPGGSTPVMRELHAAAIERFAPPAARVRWSLNEGGRAKRYRRLLRAMQHGALLTPGEADSALRVLLRTNPSLRHHSPPSCEAVAHYGGNLAVVRAGRRWRHRFATTTRLAVAA